MQDNEPSFDSLLSKQFLEGNRILGDGIISDQLQIPTLTYKKTFGQYTRLYSTMTARSKRAKQTYQNL